MIYPQNFEQKIGFDQIRQLLKDKCLSTLGEERVSDMSFTEQFEEVEEKLNQVTEFVRIIQEEDGFPDQFFFDVRPSLKRVRIEGMYLDEQELFDLRRSLETIRDIVRFLHRNEEEEENDVPYPSLKRLAGDIAVFPQLIGKIDGILNKYGKNSQSSKCNHGVDTSFGRKLWNRGQSDACLCGTYRAIHISFGLRLQGVGM